jgi:hypothetical protein
MDDNVFMDAANRKACQFMDNPESVSPEESFHLFCDLFEVTEDDAAAYFNGYKFVPEDK